MRKNSKEKPQILAEVKNVPSKQNKASEGSRKGSKKRSQGKVQQIDTTSANADKPMKDPRKANVTVI